MWLAPQAGAADTPKVEIFPSQQPILLGLNQQKVVLLFGAVYDTGRLGGAVDIAPNGPPETACPIFLSGLNLQVTAPDNTTNVPFSLTVVGPIDPRQAGQTFTCALR